MRDLRRGEEEIGWSPASRRDGQVQQIVSRPNVAFLERLDVERKVDTPGVGNDCGYAFLDLGQNI